MAVSTELKPEHLESYLTSSSIARRFLISGDEPLQRIESLDHLRHHATTQSWGSRKLLLPDLQPDIDALYACSTQSLFEESSFIELRLRAFPDTAHAKKLAAWIEQLPEDQLLMVEVPFRLNKAQLRSPWIQQLLKIGRHIRSWPVQGYFLQKWIQSRSRSLSIRMSQPATLMLGYRTEGNLPATLQVLKHLSLLYAKGAVIDEEMLKPFVSNSAQYGLFDLTDPLLGQNLPQAIIVLDGILSRKSAEPSQIIWMLAKETQQLLKAHSLTAQGKSVPQAVKSVYPPLPPSKIKMIERALGKLTTTQLNSILIELQHLDTQSKGLSSALDISEALYQVIHSFCRTHNAVA